MSQLCICGLANGIFRRRKGPTPLCGDEMTPNEVTAQCSPSNRAAEKEVPSPRSRSLFLPFSDSFRRRNVLATIFPSPFFSQVTTASTKAKRQANVRSAAPARRPLVAPSHRPYYVRTHCCEFNLLVDCSAMESTFIPFQPQLHDGVGRQYG